MPSATASIPSPKASGWLQQLCKHWSHRFVVTFDPAQGEIDFGGGERLSLTAAGDVLVMTAHVAEDGDLTALTGVVTDHLLRFAFRDPPPVEWVRPASA